MAHFLRIAHCADIHLNGLVLEQDVYRMAFTAALAEMRAHAPDLMLLAGDLFDTNAASAGTIAWAMATLAEQPFPIVMIPGNHDCMAADSIYARHDFDGIPNVTLLAAPEGEIVHLPALEVAVWGKGMVDHTPHYRPLGGCPDRPPGCRWFLGMAHGLYVEDNAESGRSSPIYRRDIEACGCDYLALGHHHAAMELVSDTTSAAFAGSPTDTVGRGATYVIAELTEGAPPRVTVHHLNDTSMF